MRKIFEVWSQLATSTTYTIETVQHLKQLIEWEFDEPYEDYITLLPTQIAKIELKGTERNPDGTSGGKYIFYLMELQCLGNSLYFILKATKYYCENQKKECSIIYSLYIEPQDYKHLLQIFALIRKLEDMYNKAMAKALKDFPQEQQDRICDACLEEIDTQLKRNLGLPK
ncbi:hypothetical protein TK0589 [Thermococcus kodakarensis KOD1]|uniref:Uncharacterized protein n=1 Tax=Thermococcus kodakarensis (strain ATCC BAA-918 / JCM 12380 / KOD1) TaxID=69014 RepID=Q5JFC5_THEKO|nr:hypothetical protein [Thermococcus kodakarensis]WCN28636.1 hypothetical protein POG15_03025 [Thermococcus kodakarensis]WCN30934.1 hypothetical protein POG21_03025 [Thermococcus kodakarensis]BAD84778.1 hypothetical protein TK0589 [Thermococcus kodakarensis KOD1]